MNYTDARDSVQDGDMVLFWRPQGWHGFATFFHALMGFITGSPVFHAAICVWMTSPTGIKRLMITEQNMLGGKRIVPLSIYSDTKYPHKMEIWHLPAGGTYSAMDAYLMANISTVYGFFDLIRIGLKEFFGMKGVQQGKSEVCSELASGAWKAGGVPMETLTSPGALRRAVIAATGKADADIVVDAALPREEK